MVPRHRFRIQIQIWGSSDSAWHFRFGPGPGSPCEAVWHLQFWEAPVPGRAASPRAGPPPALALCCRKLSCCSGLFRSPCLSLLLLIQPLQWQAQAFHDAAVPFWSVWGTQTDWALCSYVLLAEKKKNKRSNDNTFWEFRLDLWPSAWSSDPTVTLTFRNLTWAAEAGSTTQESLLQPLYNQFFNRTGSFNKRA